MILIVAHVDFNFRTDTIKLWSLGPNMESSSLQSLLSTSLEETEEPHPKKFKTDSCHVMSGEEQKKLLQRQYYINKASSIPLYFPDVLLNPNGLELQEENCKNLKTNIGQCANYKSHVNANLRHLEDILLYEKWALGSKVCIRDGASEFRENYNSLVTKTEFGALYPKEKEKSVKNCSILKENEMPIVNKTICDILAGDIITIMEALFKDEPKCQSDEDGIPRSEEKYYFTKPVKSRDTDNQTPCLCLPNSSPMKGRPFCKQKKIDEDGNIFFYGKAIRSSANNEFSGNEVFQHICMLPSRNCEDLNTTVMKRFASQLALQICNCSILAEKNDISIFNQRISLNTSQREVSKEESSIKERHIFSKGNMGNSIFSTPRTENEQMTRLLSLSDILSDNFHCSTICEKTFNDYKCMQDTTANVSLLNFLSLIPNILEMLTLKWSNITFVATKVICMQKKKIKVFNEINVFPTKKFKIWNFILRINKRHTTRRLKSNISFSNKNKYILKLGPHSRTMANKKRHGNCEDLQENPKGFVATKPNFCPFDTFKKISLNIDSEDLDQVSFIRNILFNDENNEKYGNGCTATHSRITCNAPSSLAYICVTPKLLFTNATNFNSLFEQESKRKNSQYTKDIYNNGWYSKSKISCTVFPNNDLISEYIYKNILRDDQQPISDDLCIDQNIMISINAWHSKIVLYGNRGKQDSDFTFEKNKANLQYQVACSSQLPNKLKFPKVPKLEHTNHLFHRAFFGRMHGLDSIYMKPTEDVNHIGNATVVQSFTSKINQNLNVSYYKVESAKCAGSKEKLKKLSYTAKQQVTEECLPSELINTHANELKNQFDLVLKEFNNISKEIKTGRSYGEKSMFQEDFLEQRYSDRMQDGKVSKSICGPTAVMQNENGQSLFKDTLPKREKDISHQHCSSNLSDEELFHSSSEGKLFIKVLSKMLDCIDRWESFVVYYQEEKVMYSFSAHLSA